MTGQRALGLPLPPSMTSQLVSTNRSRSLLSLKGMRIFIIFPSIIRVIKHIL